MTTKINKENSIPRSEVILDSITAITNSSCQRCGGLMITDHCFDMESNTGEFEILIRRCLTCGETIDPTILKNRFQSRRTAVPHSQEQVSHLNLQALALNR